MPDPCKLNGNKAPLTGSLPLSQRRKPTHQCFRNPSATVLSQMAEARSSKPSDVFIVLIPFVSLIFFNESQSASTTLMAPTSSMSQLFRQSSKFPWRWYQLVRRLVISRHLIQNQTPLNQHLSLHTHTHTHTHIFPFYNPPSTQCTSKASFSQRPLDSL